MAELKITRKLKNQHTHVVYLGEKGRGAVSPSGGHTHGVYPGPGPDLWEVTPGSDGHTHELTDYNPSETPISESEPVTVSGMLKDLADCMEYERKPRAKGYESEQMYSHNQWKESEIPTSQDRAALTINQIESKLDNLIGYQRQNRTDIKYLPVEDGDQVTADILNVVTRNILDQCYYAREETKVFEDSSITGRGLFHISEDYTTNIRGDIVVEQFQWDEAYCGPHNKEDLSDCDLTIKAKWFSEAKIKEMFPEKASKITPENKEVIAELTRSEDWDQRLRSQDLIDVNAKKYRVLEREKKIWKRTPILIFPADGSVFNVDGWKKEDLAAAKNIPGMKFLERVTYSLRLTKTAANVFLEDGYSEDEYFSLIPLYAKKRREDWWGKVEGIKDLQRLINKTYSLFVEILSKVSLYGFFWDQETFPSETERKKWEKNASTPGFNQQITNVERPPVKVEGIKFPQEIVAAINMFASEVRVMLNINLELQGMSRSEESGIALKQKIAQQLIGNDFLFDNLSFAKKQIGRVLVKKIQKLYDPKRIMRTLRNENAREQVELAGQPLDTYNPAVIEQVLATRDLSKYDVIVSESPSSPSMQMSNYLLLLEMARTGQPIPPQMWVELAPMPKFIKTKMMAYIEQAAQQAQMANQQKYGTEIEKAKIAQQGKLLGGGGI